MSRRVPTFLATLVLLAPAAARATYSVVATDSATGQVGGAVTSCVGNQGVGVVYRPSVGHGGVNAQAAANATGRDRAVTLLNTDVAPADIITMITASSFDANAATRQYGVVDLMGRAAGFTGSGAMNYKEDRQGTIGALTYSVQGNILTSRAVIDQAETAFRTSGCDLADKLMLALEAGAMGGEGDSRCTPRGVPSDAASIEVDLNGATAGSYLEARRRGHRQHQRGRPAARDVQHLAGDARVRRRRGRRGRYRRCGWQGRRGWRGRRGGRGRERRHGRGCCRWQGRHDRRRRQRRPRRHRRRDRNRRHDRHWRHDRKRRQGRRDRHGRCDRQRRQRRCDGHRRLNGRQRRWRIHGRPGRNRGR